MALSEKVILVINSPIGSKIKAGPGREGYEVAKGLTAKNTLGKLFCFGQEGESTLPAEKVDYFCTSEVKRQFVGWISRLHRRYPVIRGRRRIEQWMDNYYSRKLTIDDGTIMYCPKPIFPKTVTRAKELGITVILETSVLHPRFNLDVVGAEKKRLHLDGAAGYTDEVRVCNIENALKSCDKIFAWSHFLRDSYIKYGVPESKFIENTSFSPPGIDVNKFCPDETINRDEFIVLHISSITIIKGVQFLLEAWQKLADEIDGQLIIAGPADSDMKGILEKTKIKNFSWVGRVNNPVDYFQKASLFVSPSLSDAGPRTVLESMACGVPSAVSNYCGISELLTHGKDGFVYQCNDVDELVSIIKQAYENREKLNLMGKNALAKVKNFNVDTYSSEIEQRLLVVNQVAGQI